MKRRRILINPRFQVKFILTLLAFEFAMVLIFYSTNLYFFKHYLDLAKTAGLPQKHVFYGFLADQYHHMNWIFIATSIFVSIAITVFAVMFSDRIAGPLHRLNQHMKKYDPSQEHKKFEFRSSDYFVEVGETYNRHIESLLEMKSKK